MSLFHRRPAGLARRFALLAGLWLTACSLSPSPRSPLALHFAPHPSASPPVGTFLPDPPLPSLTPLPSATPFTPATATLTPTHTATPTPPPPPIFSSPSLRNGILPQTYLDACTYLERRWNPSGSPPGTVVVPIMFHSIAQPGRAIDANTTITLDYFKAFMQHARNLGFQTITAAQLVDFLEHNARIPPRSLLMIVDDRRPGVVSMFMPYLTQFDWTLTLGWISAQNTPGQWKQIEDLASTGRLDVQSHGYNHVYIYPNVTADVIHEEMFTSKALIEEHFGQVPVAYVWPGGDFTPLGVSIAHQAGYKIGFTAFSRGPLLFNWIPQGEPERKIGDPLMLLPRFWSTAAYDNLDDALKIAQQAADQAQQDRAQELAWMEAYCPGAKLPVTGSTSVPGLAP
jgi:peptidoglycan/xylan/chitin deacetylase (PgdA/CDA1 family)